MPTVDVLLPGLPFGSDTGTFGMCATVLVTSVGADGATTRLLVAHPGDVSPRTP